MRQGTSKVNQLSRRDFIARTLVASSTAALCRGDVLLGRTEENASLPIVVFSKVYQELELGFEAAAALTAEAGLNGIDCTVRPGGEILPENAARELPQYAAALNKRGLQIPLLTTAILSVSSPHAEDILRTAKKLGAPIDLYHESVVPTGLLAMGEHDLTAGEHKLTVEIVGANDKAVKNYMFGLDYVKLDPL